MERLLYVPIISSDIYVLQLTIQFLLHKEQSISITNKNQLMFTKDLFFF
jgi:hypothetical protein